VARNPDAELGIRPDPGPTRAPPHLSFFACRVGASALTAARAQAGVRVIVEQMKHEVDDAQYLYEMCGQPMIVHPRAPPLPRRALSPATRRASTAARPAGDARQGPTATLVPRDASLSPPP